MDALSRTQSRLYRIKSQVKTVLSRGSSSSCKTHTSIPLVKRHTAPSDISQPRTRVSQRHARPQSEYIPHHYHPEDLDPYLSVHLHPSVSAPRHRSADHYVGASPLTPGGYGLLEEYIEPHRSAALSRPQSTSSSVPSTLSVPSRPPSAFAHHRPPASTHHRPHITRSPARSCPTIPPRPVSYGHGSFAPTNEEELAAHLADPYYKLAGARLPTRPRGARVMPGAAVVPVYVNVYGTGRGRSRWLGGGRKK
ncbi:hypothetical protein PENSPDRAFT_687673 [Peniophora sp. CONT]|nr:hypothetical protein PENSPDRAFT_687673 [Peniophora sp. CONT]